MLGLSLSLGAKGRRAGGGAAVLDLSNGLQNFWALDEASGNRVNSERDLPLIETNGSVGVVTGLRGSGNAARLTADSDIGLLTAASAALLDGGPITISMWVKKYSTELDGVNYDQMFGVMGEVSYRGFWVDTQWSDGGPSSIRFTSNGGSSGPELNDPPTSDLDFSAIHGVWRHYVLGWDGTNNFLQINAGSRLTGAADSSMVPAAQADGRLFLGLWDYWDANTVTSPDCAYQFLGIWNHALSEAEATALYNGGQGLTRAEMNP